MPQSHYFRAAYCTPDRMASFGHQIQQVCKTTPSSVLEIGVGCGIVSSALRRLVDHVVTLDIEPELFPDICASVLDMPFPDNAFDTVLCCEVLEHLPFDCFEPALKEIARVSRQHVVISLPDVTRHYRFHVDLPKLHINRRWTFHYGPSHKPLEPGGEHYWEIGRTDYPLSRIQTTLAESGLSLEHTFRAEQLSYHRFFDCRKATDRHTSSNGRKPPEPFEPVQMTRQAQ